MATKKVKQEEILIDPLGFLDDFDGPPDDEIWAEQYPFVQWNNRERKWEFPLKHWAGSAIEAEYDLVEVDHGSETEHGFLLDTIHVSALPWRYAWERQGDDGRMIYSAQPNFDNGERWSKRYNFMCLIRETGDDTPVIITARGYTGQFLYNAINQARNRILKIAQKVTGRRFPGYLFWIPLTAGEKRLVGKEQKSAIYPPVPLAYDVGDLGEEGVNDLLRALYIGDELREVVAGYLFSEAQSWAIEPGQQQALLQAGSNEEPRAEVLPGDVLWLPDLSAHSRPNWIECAMSIPNLFDNRSHCSNAFAKVLRSQGLANAPLDRQWEAWRTELEKRWAEKLAK